MADEGLSACRKREPCRDKTVDRRGALLKKLFAKLAQAKLAPFMPPEEEKTVESPEPPSEIPLATLRHNVEQMRDKDPLIGAKIGGKVVYQRLINVMMMEDGIHAESLLCALGALAGYACQASLRRLAVEKGAREQSPFTVTSAANGKHYFSGLPLDQVLITGKYSLWQLVAEVARQAGASRLPNIDEIEQYVHATIGSEAFGIPRLPADHRPHDTPFRYLEAYWPVVQPVALQLCRTPAEWPVLFSLAVQEVVNVSGEVLSPEVAATIVMESAVPMAKVDLADI